VLALAQILNLLGRESPQRTVFGQCGRRSSLDRGGIFLVARFGDLLVDAYIRSRERSRQWGSYMN
jgi:hypothetical protein